MARANGFTAKVLVVDDEPLILEVMRIMLQSSGHMVELARDATQALATLARETFDLIITDYHMPGLKGDELASRIKAEAPSQKIMILTGAADDLLKSVPPVRADAIIRKPFQASEFLATIRKLLAADVRPASSIEAVVAQDLLQSDRQQTNLPFSY